MDDVWKRVIQIVYFFFVLHCILIAYLTGAFARLYVPYAAFFGIRKTFMTPEEYIADLIIPMYAVIGLYFLWIIVCKYHRQ